MPKSSEPYLSVVIPVHNEAERLPLTLVDMDKHLSAGKRSYEIVVVDDGSTDDTLQITKRFEKLVPNLRLITSEGGVGAAAGRGMLDASGKYRLLIDVSNPVSIDHFELMQPLLKSGVGVVVGSRDIKGAKTKPAEGLVKKLLRGLANLFIQIFVFVGVWDARSSFKCFSAKAAEEVFSLQRIGGEGFGVEALALARKLGYEAKEVPVTWAYSKGSESSLVSYTRTLFNVLKVRVWLWSGAYGLGK